MEPDNPPSGVILYAEDAQGATVQLMGRPRARYRERFWTMFLDATTTLAAMDRPAAYYRCLLFLLTVLDPVQPRRVSAREVAEGAKLSQASAERALAMLEADGVIHGKGVTGAKARRLTNRLVWASTAEKHGCATRDPDVTDSRGR